MGAEVDNMNSYKALVRLSEKYKIVDGIYKYTGSNFPHINYDKIFDICNIPKESRDAVTFGYSKMQVAYGIEFGCFDTYLLVDLNKCKVYGECAYYPWSMYAFYSESPDGVPTHIVNDFESSFDEHVKRASSTNQVLFELTESAVIKRMSYNDVLNLIMSGELS